MGDPTYEAIRAREKAEAESDRAAAEAMRAAVSAFADFFSGRATLSIVNAAGDLHIRFVRDLIIDLTPHTALGVVWP